MPSVDAELSWGDERLGVASHPLGASFDPGGPFGAMRPVSVEGDDVVLVVPARARAWIHTANGWRDLVTLRVLGCVAPDPSRPGAARVRMRRLADVDGRVEGVVIVRHPEALLELEGFWLRVGLSDDAAPATRVDRRALRSGAAFAAFTLTLFAGVLTAFGAVPPRRPRLDLTRLTPAETPRLPPVRIAPPDHATRTVETKHEVEPQPAGGRTLGDVFAPARPEPSRRPAGRRAADGPGARREGAEGLARMTAAVTALQTLGLGESPYTRRESTRRRLANDRGDWLALATIRPGTDTAELMRTSASLPGPLATGWGRGYGHQGTVPLPERRRSVTPLSDVRLIPICERTYRCGNTWSCHACDVHGTDDSDAIRRVVRQHLAEMRFCHEQGALQNPSLSGRITLRWTIAPDGHVTDVEVAEDGLGDPLVTACLRAAPLGWTFRAGASVTVVYPFVFRTWERPGSR
ncbi:MAG: AgmX/PglI C-terminal domain-containing protein [Sandaracinaceae bacterium]|nr:AgmX/PglI C-terminal domain-containing protein [Sandaracinaceae bacterium]